MTKLRMSRLTAIKFFQWCLLGLSCCIASVALAGDFQFKDLQANTHHLREYRGKWVLVNFWATWCSPCLSEIPELNSLHDAHPNLVVIGVAMQSGDKSTVQDFAHAHQMRYPIVMGTRDIARQVIAAAGQSGTLEVLPVSFLFGPKGELVYDKAGIIDAKLLTRLLQ